MTAPAKARKTTRKPLSAAKRAELNEKRQAEASDLHRQIALKVQTLAEGDEWLAYLAFMKGFHTYSFNNIMLMMAQRMERGLEMPSLVAGFKAWQEKGRQVRTGERGLRIFGFSKKLVTDADGNAVLDDHGKKQYRVFYPIVSVFDVDQTDQIEGTPPVDAHEPVLLTGDDQLGLTAKVDEWLQSIGWTLDFEPTEGDRRGRTMLDGSRRVLLSDNLEPAQMAKTALHEMAHVILHANGDGAAHEDAEGLSRAVIELEAESAAYVAGAILGLDTERYSDKYLLHWASRTEGTPSEAIKATAARVQKAVAKMVSVLEEGE